MQFAWSSQAPFSRASQSTISDVRSNDVHDERRASRHGWIFRKRQLCPASCGRRYRRNPTALDPDRRTRAIISVVRQAASAPRVKKGRKQSIQLNSDNRKVGKGLK